MRLCGLPKDGEELFKKLLESNASSEEKKPEVLMTTLRYDPQLKHLTRRVPIAMEDSDDDVFFLSKLHHRRLKYGATLLRWDGVHISHSTMVAKMNEAVEKVGKDQPQRVRVTADHTGAIEVTSTPIPERDDLFKGLSTQPAKDNSIDPVFTVFLSEDEHKAAITNMIKTTNRAEYDELRKRLQSVKEEVLLVGTNQEILEGSMMSVAFKRNDEWVTPKLNNGGMVGTTRSLLLGLGFVKEGTILKSEVQNGEQVLLFNGVQGVVAGFISL